MEESYCSSCGSNLSTSREAKQSFVSANGLNNRPECVCCYSYATVMMSLGPSQKLNKLR